MMLARRTVRLLMAALLVPSVAFATPANWGRGPIEIDNQYFFSQFHLSAAPRSTALAEGNDARISAAWSNTSIVEDRYTVDLETVTVPLELRSRIDINTELGISVPIIARGGGVLDNLIESWHDFFSLPGGDRHKLDDDSYRVAGRNTDGTEFDFGEERTDLGSTSVSVKHLLTAGDERSSAWAMRGAVGLPTATSEYGNDGVDFQIELLGSRRLGSWIGYWGAAGQYYSDTQSSGLEFRSVTFEGFSAVEYELLEGASALLGVNAGSQAVKEIDGHPDYFIYLDIGVVADLSERTQVELLLRENPAPGDASVDVTFLMGLRVALR